MSSAWKFGNWTAASWDKLHRGRHVLLGIEQWIFRERSEFQEVVIARVPDFGKGLFLDAVVELLEADEFVYHESMALPPLLFHPSPKRVLIEGGGDGLALREVLRDPRVEEVVLVELDPLVIEACKAHLAELHRGSFDDPRARILVQDVFPFLEAGPEPFDVILVDLLDGYDAASALLYEKVLGLTKRALGPGGILGTFGDLAEPLLPIGQVYRHLKELFGQVALHRAAIESFAGGYGFLLASNTVDFASTPTPRLLERAAALEGDLRALTPEAFPSCFAVPPYLARALEDTTRRPETSLAETSLADDFSWLFPD